MADVRKLGAYTFHVNVSLLLKDGTKMCFFLNRKYIYLGKIGTTCLCCHVVALLRWSVEH